MSEETSPGERRQKTLSWESPRLRAVEEECNRLQQALSARAREERRSGKDIAGEVWSEESRLFNARFSYDDLRHLAALCETLPPRFRDRSGFPARLLDFIVERFAAAGDRQGLVNLLAKRCVCRIGYCSDIEYYLVSNGNLYQEICGRRLEDPILILGEAYAQCKEPEVRRDIAGAVRRGFVCAGISEKDDAEFVQKAMEWYQQNKDSLAVNNAYWYNEVSIPLEDWDASPERYEREWAQRQRREPLFAERFPGQVTHNRFVAVFNFWVVHAGLALVLALPIVFLSWKRVRWRWWHLLALVAPFCVWQILMATQASPDRKGIGNVVEAIYLALAVPVAALALAVIGARLRQAWSAVVLLCALCLAAVAIFLTVPPMWD